MSHHPHKPNQNYANNLLTQQYTTKLILGICNVLALFCFLWDEGKKSSNIYFFNLIYIYNFICLSSNDAFLPTCDIIFFKK